jgi:hypothetical protein
MVHLLSMVNMILYTKGVFGNISSSNTTIRTLWIQMVIFVIFAPIYFWVKGDAKTPWIYTLTTFVTHLVIAISVSHAFVAAKSSISLTVSIWEVLITTLFGCLILLDIAITFWKTIVNKEK